MDGYQQKKEMDDTEDNQILSYAQERGTLEEDVVLEFPDIGMDAESENPIIVGEFEMQGVFVREVLGRALLFLAMSLLITVLGMQTTSPEKAPLVYEGFFPYILFGILVDVFIVARIMIRRNMLPLVIIMYVVYTYLSGVVFAVLFGSVKEVVLLWGVMSALCFGMGFYGIFCKADITNIGHAIFMFVTGTALYIGADKIFLNSSKGDLCMGVIAIVFFVGLTVFDLNRLKGEIWEITDEPVMRLAFYTGFQINLDYIIMLIILESTLNTRRNNRDLDL